MFFLVHENSKTSTREIANTVGTSNRTVRSILKKRNQAIQIQRNSFLRGFPLPLK
jgi:predicted transcriptional regulator